uniref:amidohydrolase family protein n=1 Tax=uncultured Sphingomonas sp. TaxID=158754 RepID=UPI0025F4C9D3|nr:amidohydrolase family protein [uncultured Sphingomonas sp.]
MGEQRGRGRFDHHAERTRRLAELGGNVPQDRARRAELANVDHHGQHDPALGERHAGNDRAKLGTEKVGPGQRETNPARAQRITARDGACFAANGTLAGSDLNMAQAVRNAQPMLDVTLPVALAMASRNPATFLGLDGDLGRIARGARADLVLLGFDGAVRRTWIGGLE